MDGEHAPKPLERAPLVFSRAGFASRGRADAPLERRGVRLAPSRNVSARLADDRRVRASDRVLLLGRRYFPREVFLTFDDFLCAFSGVPAAAAFAFCFFVAI